MCSFVLQQELAKLASCIHQKCRVPVYKILQQDLFINIKQSQQDLFLNYFLSQEVHLQNWKTVFMVNNGSPRDRRPSVWTEEGSRFIPASYEPIDLRSVPEVHV